MRITVVRILVGILLFIHMEQAAGQCLSEQALWENIDKSNKQLNGTDLLAAANKLQVKYQQCKVNNDSIKAKILHVIGRSYWHLDSLTLAKKYTEKAIEANLVKSGSAKIQNCVNSYLNLFQIEKELGNTDLAKQCAQNGIKLASQYSDKRSLLPQFYMLLANLYNNSGDYQKCIQYADLGEREALKRGLFESGVNNRIEKIQALISLNRLKEAQQLISGTSNILAQITDLKTKGFVRTQIANLYDEQGQYQQAIEQYKRSVSDYKGHLKVQKSDKNAMFNCGVAINNIGNIYLEGLKEYPKALQYFNESLQYIDDRQAKARIIGNIADTYTRLGNYENAVGKYQEALNVITSLVGEQSYSSNPPAQILRQLPGKFYALTLIRDKAKTWLEYAKSSNNNRNSLRNALNTFMLADTMIDYMRWEHSGNVSKLFWRGKTRSIYESAIEVCFLLKDPERAFYFFEKSRAVMLNDQLNELGANELLSIADRKSETGLKEKVSELREKLEGFADDPKAAASVRTQLLAAEERHERFVMNIETKYPRYYAYKYDNNVLSIPELRTRVLSENQVYLSYFVGDVAVYGLCVLPQSVKLEKLDHKQYTGIRDELERLISDRATQNRGFVKYLGTTTQFYNLAIRPFDIEKGKRIIVSPDGNFFPYAALSTSALKPHYLVNDYAFSYTYSAGFLAKSKNRSATTFSRNTFLGLAPGAFNSHLHLASLPGSESILKKIAGYFTSAKTLTGSAASKKSFIGLSPEYKIVQLFTHATADSTEASPTLFFADSTIQLTELGTSNRSQIELLVLSACETAVGKNETGEGVFSLARGFAGTGIPSTLTTLWSVENEPVYDLTQHFYEQMTNGTPLDIALQQAQIGWLSKASSAEQLPYTWAGMVLVGKAEPIQMGLSKRVVYGFLSGGVMALLLGSVLFLRRKSARK